VSGLVTHCLWSELWQGQLRPVRDPRQRRNPPRPKTPGITACQQGTTGGLNDRYSGPSCWQHRRSVAEPTDRLGPVTAPNARMHALAGKRTSTRPETDNLLQRRAHDRSTRPPIPWSMAWQSVFSNCSRSASVRPAPTRWARCERHACSPAGCAMRPCWSPSSLCGLSSTAPWAPLARDRSERSMAFQAGQSSTGNRRRR
jgi:hypothetical protein